MVCGIEHFVRVSVLGQVGRFLSMDGTCFPRGVRVICRTRRGLEIGQVLANTPSLQAGRNTADRADGTIIRGATVEDELLAARLERHRDEAFAACRALLQERGICATLMDVEHLFDGQSIYFYFLGPTTPELESLTNELAALYTAKIEFSRFHDALITGCGPDCGTEKAHGCSSSGCATCAVAAACRS